MRISKHKSGILREHRYLATADKHPYRSAAIGAGVRLAFGMKKTATFNSTVNIGAISGTTSNIINQSIAFHKLETEKFNIPKLVYSGFSGGLLSGMTYGAPLLSSLIISWGPSAFLGKLGDEVFK